MEITLPDINILGYAFIGDAVYSQLSRSYVVKKHNGKISILHKMTNKFVNAKSQAMAFDFLKALFTKDEFEIANRARNAKSNNVPKNACLEEYKKSTSLEAVFGYNFLNNNHERNNELFNIIIEMEINK